MSRSLHDRPAQLGEYRERQRTALAADPEHVGEKGAITITDDEIRASLDGAQVRLQHERGIDLTLFSPRASWMGHHLGNVHTSRFWTEHCNELIRRVCDLYPDTSRPVCQLPQSPGAPVEPSVAELRTLRGGDGVRWLQPQPGSERWGVERAAAADRSWYPLYEALCELDVPAMIHVERGL